MGQSNEEWGSLATDDQRAAWDGYDRLPFPGESPPLDAFLARKHLDIAALVRIGARLSAPTVLAVAFEGGIKYRDVVTNRRTSYEGSTFDSLKLIPGRDSDTVILCEGETDAARLTMLYDCDVGLLPSGAGHWTDGYATQVAHYDRVFVGLDDDQAGERGWMKIQASLPHAVRWRPPANDWCEVEGDPPPLPEKDHVPTSLIVFAGELDSMKLPERVSWFADAILPVSGSMLIHGWTKSFKSFVGLDILAAIAQGEPWGDFESEEEAAKVAVVNYEITYPFYRERVDALRARAKRPELFDANFGTYSPLSRPRQIAGASKSEDEFFHLVEETGVQVVLIDPVRRAIGRANVNAEDDSRIFLGFAEELGRRGVTVLYVHHDNKAGAQAGGGDLTSVTGSGAWVGDADTIVSVARPKDYPKDRRLLWFTLRNRPDPGPRQITMKDGWLKYSTDTDYVAEGDQSL